MVLTARLYTSLVPDKDDPSCKSKLNEAFAPDRADLPDLDVTNSAYTKVPPVIAVAAISNSTFASEATAEYEALVNVPFLNKATW
jgi:hypothetical protein